MTLGGIKRSNIIKFLKSVGICDGAPSTAHSSFFFIVFYLSAYSKFTFIQIFQKYHQIQNSLDPDQTVCKGYQQMTLAGNGFCFHSMSFKIFFPDCIIISAACETMESKFKIIFSFLLFLSSAEFFKINFFKQIFPK